MDKTVKKFLVRDGKIVGYLGNEERFYDNMQKPCKKKGFADVINK